MVWVVLVDIVVDNSHSSLWNGIARELEVIRDCFSRCTNARWIETQNLEKNLRENVQT